VYKNRAHGALCRALNARCGHTQHGNKREVKTNGGVLGGLPPGPGALWEKHATFRLFLKSLKRGRGAGGPRVGKYPQTPGAHPLGSSSTSSPFYYIIHPHLRHFITTFRHYPLQYYQQLPTSCPLTTSLLIYPPTNNIPINIHLQYIPSAFTTPPSRRPLLGRRPFPHMTLSYATHISTYAPHPSSCKKHCSPRPSRDPGLLSWW
jgi:hypothetical protein